MSDRLSIAFQGTKSGLVIAIDDALPFQTMLSKLQKKLDNSGDFFIDAEVALNLGKRALTEKDLKLIKQIIQEKHHLKIIGVEASSEETLATVELLGLPRLSTSTQEEDSKDSFQSSHIKARDANGHANQLKRSSTELIRRTLRSGQIYESRNNIVILGDVNAGAEVISAGDIIVFGALRGVAHAGAAGNKSAIIMAWKLRPTQLRIANRIARSNDEQKKSSRPEYVCIEKDRIMIDEWTNATSLKI